MCEDVLREPFIRDIETALGCSFDVAGRDFSSYGAGPGELIYVRTGGTEGLFKEIFCKDGGRPVIGEPVRLLTSGKSNSLAASMEILSFLNLYGIRGEILHGSPQYIASRIASGMHEPERTSCHPEPSVLSGAEGKAPCHPERSMCHPERSEGSSSQGHPHACHPERSACHPERSEDPSEARDGDRQGAKSGEAAEGDLTLRVSPGRILAGCRLGVIGRPSDWLISSNVDYDLARSVLGVELVDVDMDELLAEIAMHSHPVVDVPPLNKPKFGNPIPEQDLAVALDIYGALLHIIAKYRLDGLTIRCFDLLGTVHNTGCLSLALLNSQGYTATCEGDIPAMISMAIARKVCGQSGFQANLSSVDGDRLLFAHCTVPLSMTRSWVYDTHFESGFGVAIHGELPVGDATIFKLSPDFTKAFIAEATLEHNCYEGQLCRTQIILRAAGIAPYFLTTPIGNHHIILPGNHAEALRAILR